MLSGLIRNAIEHRLIAVVLALVALAAGIQATQVGQLVRVPLGGRVSLGVVWRYPAEPPPGAKLRSIVLLEHEQPVMTPDCCQLAEWMAGYYGCGLNSVLETVLPAAMTTSRL